MLGDINMNTNKITSLYFPVDNNDIVNKIYVDTSTVLLLEKWQN